MAVSARSTSEWLRSADTVSLTGGGLGTLDQRMVAPPRPPTPLSLKGSRPQAQKRLDTPGEGLSSQRGIGSVTDHFTARGRPNSRALAQLPRDAWRGTSGQATVPAHWHKTRVTSPASIAPGP